MCDVDRKVIGTVNHNAQEQSAQADDVRWHLFETLVAGAEAESSLDVDENL